ncbi:hypothetical protein BJX63DRAFT_397081 [Aspergillus granulosus]|uniref:Uncharacterized protein n=1 Tax=Aspergillus granulosus TaxID=176169 RepID=A0ABR4HAH1_9EURO
MSDHKNNRPPPPGLGAGDHPRPRRLLDPRLRSLPHCRDSQTSLWEICGGGWKAVTANGEFAEHAVCEDGGAGICDGLCGLSGAGAYSPGNRKRVAGDIYCGHEHAHMDHAAGIDDRPLGESSVLRMDHPGGNNPDSDNRCDAVHHCRRSSRYVPARFRIVRTDRIVTPKLRMGPFEDRMLVGDVYASFANTAYLADNCETPVALESDPDYRNLTCLNMQHAGQAYHNYQAFLHAWSLATEGTRSSSTELASRPLPTGSVHDNTTVTGSWIEMQNMTALSEKYGRIVHNVTAAMPHGGIIGAANHHANGITQPRDRSGEGNYELVASVPSPAVNVLCVGMNKTELAPIVYTEWPNTEGDFHPVNWTISVPDNVPSFDNWHNRTVVDDIFGFGPDYPGMYAPIFGKLPEPHNTILNVTGQYLPGAIYLLGAAPPEVEPKYVLCSLRAKQSSACSTQYKATASGSELSTRCEDGHSFQYNVRNPDTPTAIWQPDWKSIASEWAFTLSLNAGITDGLSTNARLLMQFLPKTPSLNPDLPSISEALAVLAGNTLLMSSQNAPFVHFWNYSVPENILPEPDTQSFNATIRSVEYASGGTQRWQGIFYPILLFAFITSALCLAFMLLEVRGKQITDFTEPQNLFALAMNSPSTTRLQGACGAGPEGHQLKERWYVAMEQQDEHYYIQSKAEENTPRVSVHRARSLDDIEMEEQDPGQLKTTATNSPAIDEYRRLSSRKSWLSRTFY